MASSGYRVGEGVAKVGPANRESANSILGTESFDGGTGGRARKRRQHYIPICSLISELCGRLKRSEQTLPLHDHVTRNATIGSTVIARRAGK